MSSNIWSTSRLYTEFWGTAVNRVPPREQSIPLPEPLSKPARTFPVSRTTSGPCGEGSALIDWKKYGLMSDYAIGIMIRKLGRGSNRMSQTQLKPHLSFVLRSIIISLGILGCMTMRGASVASAAEPPATADAGLEAFFAQLSASTERQKGDASISGIVVDKQGNPLSGMKIINGGDLFATQLPPTESNAEGKFSASELMPGEYRIMAVPAVSGGMGFDSGYQKVTLKAGQAVGDIGLVYEGAGERTVSGKVTDSKGDPIAGVRIDSADFTATQSVRFSTYTETGADGRFVLEAREGKRFDVSVTHPSYTEARFYRWEAGTNDLEIVLQGRGTIIGQVVDADTGKPVTHFDVGSGVRMSPRMLGVRDAAFATFDDAEGRFTLPSVEVGEVNVYVRAQGYAPMRIQVPEMKSDEVRDLAIVRLESGATLEGTVKDMSGAPISRALILLSGDIRDSAMYPEYLSTSRFSGEQYHAMTDDEGRFAIDSLSPELTKFELRHVDHARTEGKLALTLSQRTTVDWVMTGFATVEGTVYVNGEKAGAGNRVSAGNDSMIVSMTVSRSAETDAQGFYRIEEVPAGSMIVQVGTQEGGSMRHAKAEATTSLGHTTVVDLYVEYGTATITGKVIWDGDPVPNVTVSASVAGGDDYASGMVSPAGTYKITGLNGGDYQVYVADVLSGKPKILGIVKTTVAAGETATVDIECGDK